MHDRSNDWQLCILTSPSLTSWERSPGRTLRVRALWMSRAVTAAASASASTAGCRHQRVSGVQCQMLSKTRSSKPRVGLGNSVCTLAPYTHIPKKDTPKKRVTHQKSFDVRWSWHLMECPTFFLCDPFAAKSSCGCTCGSLSSHMEAAASSERHRPQTLAPVAVLKRAMRGL